MIYVFVEYIWFGVLREYCIFAMVLHIFHILEIPRVNVEELCFCALGNGIFCLCIVTCTELFRAVHYNSQGKIHSNH